MSAGAYIWGWDATNKVWRKVLVNAEGKLIIDPTEIFEDTPTDGETGKAPTSNWAYDHKADPDAHHAKDHAATHQDTGDDEISVAGLSGELADRQKSKTGDSTLGWTDEKLLKGAGAGVAPEEVDVPSAGATLTIAETQVFSGTSPTTWTDLDLSGVIGANPTLVLLKCGHATLSNTYAVRKNGDTDEFYQANYSAGVANGEIGAIHLALLVATDSAGIIEWTTRRANAGTTVDIIAYIK